MKSLNYKENHQIKIDVKPLYLSAFPKNERPPAHYFFKKAEKENNDIFAYYENDEFIGFSQLTTYKDICYIFFLAVSENHRNEGYGSKILSDIKENNKDKVILLCYEEVDDRYLDNENRKRRKAFYIKNGFQYNNLKTNEFGVIFETAIYGNHYVPFEDYVEIFVQGFGEFARQYIKKEN